MNWFPSMAKNSTSPLNKAARMLDLVPYLHAHQGIALETLAQNFGVTESEMNADLTTLWMCGLPGYTPLELIDLSFDSGFVTIRNAQTLENPRSLNKEEAIALLLGLDLVRSALSVEREDLITKIDLLSQRLRGLIGLQAHLKAEPAIDGSIRSTITKSIASGTSLDIRYHSLYADRISQRTILPIEWQNDAFHEYVFAYCDQAQSFRTFRLDRIQYANEGVKKLKAEKVSKMIESPARAYRIRIHSHLRAARELFEFEGDDKELHTGIEKEISSFTAEWMRRMIFSAGASVELLSPEAERADIVSSARALLALYEGK
ncbi:MAG: WYL domain-containing protein [Actinobacteria bacterium]|nr:WYL domain-containing protein [Actinomycetota bacterium]